MEYAMRECETTADSLSHLKSLNPTTRKVMVLARIALEVSWGIAP